MGGSWLDCAAAAADDAGGDDCYNVTVQVAVCCSLEQLHTQDFIRTVEPAIVIDSDEASPLNVLPPVGEFALQHSRFLKLRESGECNMLWEISKSVSQWWVQHVNQN